LFVFYSLYRIKNKTKKLPQIVYRLANEFLKFKMVKNILYIFEKIFGRKSEGKNINKIEKILKISEKQSLWLKYP
jgi:hypothetical protein